MLVFNWFGTGIFIYPYHSGLLHWHWGNPEEHAWVNHAEVIKWKHFPRYWPFVRGIHRSPVNSPHKDQWRGAFMFSLICAWINRWVNNRKAGYLRRHCAHYDVIVMSIIWIFWWPIREPLQNKAQQNRVYIRYNHGDTMTWKKFPHYCPFVRGIHRQLENSPRKAPAMSIFIDLKEILNKHSSCDDLRSNNSCNATVLMCYPSGHTTQ